jgi:hypothetical protein
MQQAGTTGPWPRASNLVSRAAKTNPEKAGPRSVIADPSILVLVATDN